MFYKKKKEYSEVSETNLNINSDYFKIFQNELKNIFPNDINNNTNLNYNSDNIDIDNKISDNLNKNIEDTFISNKNLNCKDFSNNKMINESFKKVSLDKYDIFIINMFVKHFKNINK